MQSSVAERLVEVQRCRDAVLICKISALLLCCVLPEHFSFPCTLAVIVYQNKNDEWNWENFEFVLAVRVFFFAKHSPVLHGRRWSVNSSAWQWRRRCALCWTRWHQTCSPASVDFAPKDRYLTPPSTCQPGVPKKKYPSSHFFDIYLKMSVWISIMLLHTYHFFGNVANWNLIIRWDVLLLGGNKISEKDKREVI